MKTLNAFILVLISTLMLVIPSFANAEMVTLLAGTEVETDLVENINGGLNKQGDTIKLRVIQDVKVNNKIVIAKDALVTAKISSVSRKGSMGRGGGLNFYPQRIMTVDSQAIPLDKQTFTSQGGGASLGRAWFFGPMARGREGYVLRGTKYQVTIRRDTKIDVSKTYITPKLKNAALSLDGSFKKTRKVKFSLGKTGDDLILQVTLTPELNDSIPDSLESIKIVKVLDYILHEPVSPIKIEKNKKNGSVNITFSAWSIIRYAQPGETPIIIQLKLSDGKIAQVDTTLITVWKLK